MNNTMSAQLSLRQVGFNYGHRFRQGDSNSNNHNNRPDDKDDSFQFYLSEVSVQRGEKIAITGPSGSGKTTLLYLIAGILLPQRGDILVADTAINQQSERWRRQFRASQIGMVFQSFELLEYLSVLDNILLPLRLMPKMRVADYRSRAMILARQTGIEDKLYRRPAQLSQGEQQRVAVCRALICKPQLILADEPTGNLDANNKLRVVDLLLRQCDEIGASLLMVTHDESLIDRFDRTCTIEQLLTTPGTAP
jgi:putative ABC transport system ATP-binding protein